MARLSVLSSLLDITAPGDTIVSFGDTSTSYPAEADPANAINNDTTKYRNGGVGLNAFTGFPPYEGPAGVIVTPVSGFTRVTGLRIYTANDAVERDPTSFEFAGSNDGGTTFTPITSGVLALPTARNAAALFLEPLTQPMQEVLFPNGQGFTTYKLTVNHVRDDLTANSFQFGDLELLGEVVAKLSVASGTTPGTLVISTSLAGTLWSSADLRNWQSEGAIVPGTPITITIGAAGPARFYQIRP